MTENLAEIVVATLVIYAVIGVVFGLFFVIAGAKWVNHGAAGMPVRARITVFPGAALLWPVLAVMLIAARGSS